jgi:Fur family ferric uptake transcriptional regulator
MKFRGNKRHQLTLRCRVILDELRSSSSHMSADEIYEKVRKRIPRISLATVYRNLELLTKMGLIQKLEWAGTQKRYDGNVKAHYHIRCIECGKVEDLSIGPIPAIENAIKGLTNYEIIGHRLEVIGRCPECYKRDQNKERKEEDLL